MAGIGLAGDLREMADILVGNGGIPEDRHRVSPPPVTKTVCGTVHGQ